MSARPSATVASSDHTITPDVETASDAYARRFAGDVGRFFLDTQRQIVAGLLARYPSGTLSILEIGGGHGQLTELLLGYGHRVVVHGSDLSCFTRLEPLQTREPKLELVTGSLNCLPFSPRSFDLVLAFRLLPHTSDHNAFLQAAAELARMELIFDYAPLMSGNLLSTLLFPIKRAIEKNTRPFFTHRLSELRSLLTRQGFGEVREFRQFSFPMGLHRMLSAEPISRKLEKLAGSAGITRLAGSPSVVSARRNGTRSTEMGSTGRG